MPSSREQIHRWWHTHTAARLVDYCSAQRMGEFQRHRPERSKSNAKVGEQEKLINGDRSQNSGFRWEVLIGSRSEGTFWVTENVLYLYPSGEFTEVSI